MTLPPIEQNAHIALIGADQGNPHSGPGKRLVSGAPRELQGNPGVQVVCSGGKAAAAG